MMKLLLSVVFLFLFSAQYSAQFVEDFSDGDFTTTNLWEGDSDQFIVNGSNQLQLDDTEAGQRYLSSSVPLTGLDNIEWRFFIKQSFSGSSNNYSRVYLTSQIQDLSFESNDAAGAQGYFLLFGEAGSDDTIRLFRDDNTGDNPVEVLSGGAGIIASSFEISVRVTRDASGNWSLFTDLDAGDQFIFQSSAMDDTYTTSAYSGVVCNFTVSNATSFYYDDFYIGEEEVDETAPEVTLIDVLNATQLQVEFSEPIDETSAEILANYNVIGLGNPNDAVWDDVSQTSVLLTFPGSFAENTESQIEFSGITDISSNAIENTTLPFTYVVSAVAEAGDVVINEILADPSPVIGLPEFEFVELLNTSDEFYDLANWVFVNTNTEKILPSFPLAPGGIVILCDESAVADYQAYGDVIGIASFTALSNSGDSLTLKSPENLITDIVVYTDDWYNNPLLDDGGVSLERINPSGGCSGQNNWTASESFSGGSPGIINTVFDDSPDLTPPTLVFQQLVSLSVLELTFDDQLDFNAPSEVLIDAGVLTVQNTVLTNNNSSLLITFTTEVEPGIVYPLEINNVIDCSGNTIAQALELEIVVGFEPAPGDLIITEMMPDPDDDFDSPNDEYIELYNKSNLTLELTNVTLSGGIFTQQVILEPGEYLIVTNEDNIGTFLVWPNTIGMDGFPALTNSGRLIELFNGDEELLDAVGYDISWYRDSSKDDGGWSLELINTDLPCSGASNWTASNDESGATPGVQNSVFDMSPDLIAPEITTALVEGPTEILLQFNEAVNDDLSGLEVSIGRFEGSTFVELDYELISSNVISAEEEPYPTQVLLTFDQAFSTPIIYEIHLSGIADCSGNSVLLSDFTFAMFAVPEVHEAGDLIINEILFNPKDDGVDYLEIYNRSNKNINLEGWKITNTTSEPQVISTEQQIIFRGDYALLSVSSLAVKDQYPLGKEENFIELDGFPSFSNSGGTAVLMDSLEVESDELIYSEDQQYPLLNSTDGVALERIDPFRKSSDPTNWHSASESVGFGTPGYLNSQNTSAFSEGELSVSPEVFSPDNDGFEDVLNISVELPKEGFTGTISIYNDRGLLIRTLVLSDLLGTTETFSWDGFDNQQLKAGIGMYVIHFEGFHPDGDTIDEKAVGVLGARLN